MKNTHLKQLINPTKIFNFLQKLKEAGSPYHQDIKSPEAFKALCSQRDKYGYKAIYSDSEDDDEEMEQKEDDKTAEEEEGAYAGLLLPHRWRWALRR